MKNPFLNALLASVYIVGLVTFVEYVLVPEMREGFMIPIVMLSLFVLSAAVMGYLFLGVPIQMYFDGNKKESVRFFLSTVLTFGVVTFGIITLVITGSRFL